MMMYKNIRHFNVACESSSHSLLGSLVMDFQVAFRTLTVELFLAEQLCTQDSRRRILKHSLCVLCISVTDIQLTITGLQM